MKMQDILDKIKNNELSLEQLAYMASKSLEINTLLLEYVKLDVSKFIGGKMLLEEFQMTIEGALTGEELYKHLLGKGLIKEKRKKEIIDRINFLMS